MGFFVIMFDDMIYHMFSERATGQATITGYPIYGCSPPFSKCVRHAFICLQTPCSATFQTLDFVWHASIFLLVIVPWNHEAKRNPKTNRSQPSLIAVPIMSSIHENVRKSDISSMSGDG